MDNFTLEELLTNPYLKKLYYDPLNEEVDLGMFSNKISVSQEDVDEQITLPIVTSRDAYKRDSLIKTIVTIIESEDQDEWDVDTYSRQQSVLDECVIDNTIDTMVDNIVFPEVGAERLTEKKIAALSYVQDSVVVAARNNENVLTHCTPYFPLEEEAVVFTITLAGGASRSYLWHGSKITKSNSRQPLWLRALKDEYINMTDSYLEDNKWRLPVYLTPGINPDLSYYVWINGLPYIVTTHHIFTLRADNGTLRDKNGKAHGDIQLESTGKHLAVTLPEGRILGETTKGVDSTQIISSMFVAGVTSRQLVEKYPELERKPIMSLDTKVYIREYPDTRVLGFQLIGRSHSLIKHKILQAIGDHKREKVVIGHSIYPAFEEPNSFIKYKGKIYRKKRKRHVAKMVVAPNKQNVPMGVWFQIT